MTLVCANCGADLAGEYCAACGQRHEPHVHTVGHFASEAFESISHADSRLWRTLWLLLTRPGFLTREFLAGRRARYLPPFRLYLVISVLFFLIVGLPETVAIDVEAGASGGPSPSANEDEMRVGTGTKEAKAGIEEFCSNFDEQTAAGDPDRMSIFKWCRRFQVNGPAAVAESVAHNIPRAMFIFLPLLALVMKLLYWRPNRYYVEHLLLLVHNHAFVFLLLTLIGLIAPVPGVPGALVDWLNWAAFLYMTWYIYRGMRNVYAQGRGLTLAKYFTLGLAYVCTSLTVLLMTAIYGAMTY